MPFKTFAAGETLTSSDVNTYLARQAVIVCTSGTRPSSPPEGMVIYETDTDRILVWDGATWNLPRDVAGGTLGYAQVTANQTGITSEADLAGLAATATVLAGRRIKVTVGVTMQHSAASEYVTVRIKEGTTQLRAFVIPWNQAATEQTFDFAVRLTPTAGAHTYKATAQRTSGTGTLQLNASATNPAYIAVEDIGGA